MSRPRQEFIHEQVKDTCCHQASPTVGFLGYTYNYDRNGFWRTGPTGGALQNVFLTFLQPQLQYQWHCSLLAGHPEEWQMYDTMRREYYWLHMANDVYMTVRYLRECIWYKLSEKRWRPFQLFSGRGRLKLVAIDIFGPLPKKLKGSQYVLVMKYSYSKLTCITDV